MGDLTTATVLEALRRFSARRGAPKEIWSDNVTTFHGADAELWAAFREANLDCARIGGTLANEGMTWRFIPPGAPHFGGLWEAGVESAKFHLRKIIGQRILTYEEMNTLMAQVESCMNSRPLVPLTGEIDDVDALTPGHLLTGYALTAPAEPPSDDDQNLDRLTRWRLVQAMRDHFWTRWSKEYLNTLTQRHKWQRPREKLAVGDVVLILDSLLLYRGRWPLGKILEVNYGADGRARVASVQAHRGIFTQPVTKICRMPVS